MVANAGLTLDVEYAYSDLAEGYVCDQNPKANEEVGRGSAVTATISRGKRAASCAAADRHDADGRGKCADRSGTFAGLCGNCAERKTARRCAGAKPRSGGKCRTGRGSFADGIRRRVVVPELVGQREEEAVERMASVG